MAKLSYAARKKLPAKSFAIPGSAAGKARKAKGSYPIEDEAHARNALARVSQFGSPEEKARVRAAVHRKYPNIGRKSHSVDAGVKAYMKSRYGNK